MIVGIFLRQKNTAFTFAINSQNNSGEKYIASAIEKGIKTIVSENYYPQFGINWIIVENSIEFLQKLAQFHIKNSQLDTTIGITGKQRKNHCKRMAFTNAFGM